MKKFLVLSLAILFFAGIAEATGIPGVVNPYDQPVVWTEDVYNGTSSDIATQRVVQWDFDTCDVTDATKDDMCPWVKTADDTDSVWIAGVTLSSKGIAAYETGQIIIKGPAVVYDGAGDSVCTAGEMAGAVTGGAAADVSQAGTDDGYLGVSIKATATQQGYPLDALIYVNPTLSYDN